MMTHSILVLLERSLFLFIHVICWLQAEVTKIRQVRSRGSTRVALCRAIAACRGVQVTLSVKISSR